MGLKTWIRLEDPIRKKKHIKVPNSENNRWFQLIDKVHTQNSNFLNLIHVADQECDDYTCLSKLMEKEIRFVIRAKHDRKIPSQESERLFGSLNWANVVIEREVNISARKRVRAPKASREHPARDKRTALLGISSKKIEICKSKIAEKECPKTLELNFVRVFELNPPAGEAPIEWRLITSESIQTAAEPEQIVDVYRNRWTIEEYFKSLKTGCNFEKRGLETYDALLRCLAIFAPVACQVYNLKILARQEPKRNSSSLCLGSALQLQLSADT